jgi:uncharacterized DUF497 family protein
MKRKKIEGSGPNLLGLCIRCAYNTLVRYAWDPQKAATNLDKHGIDFADAVAVLEDPSALTLRADDEAGEERLVTAGVDFLGRVLVVVYTHRRDSIRLISARPASKAERRVYERKRV